VSYPRNNAAPPPIGIGEVRALADGALQTTDVLVRVKIGTGSWGAGAGTLACDATSGEWTYTPTQAETNAESFVVAIYKTDCFGASVTVVTSASGTAGKASIDPTQYAALLANTGTGARTLTVTVNDGTDPLEGAKVRFTRNAEDYIGTTNASGQVAFGLDDGTWSVAITLAGYTFAPTTKVVSATGSQTYSMTAQSITASEPGQVTGYLYAYDELGAVEAGVVYTLAMIRAATGYGAGPDSKARTATSDALGLVQFTGMFPGATYSIQRGSSPVASFKVPAGTTGNYSIPNVLGQEAA
jgi:hypothetical protein